MSAPLGRNLLNLYGLGRLPFSASGASALACGWHLGARALGIASWADAGLLVALLAGSAVLLRRHAEIAASDPREIVVDEASGMLLALVAAGNVGPIPVLIAFVAFRAIDLLKPPPFGWIDRRARGWFAPMIDDLAIGAVVGACVNACLRLAA
jgi:phosphatidylglycerophosphatase A